MLFIIIYIVYIYIVFIYIYIYIYCLFAFWVNTNLVFGGRCGPHQDTSYIVAYFCRNHAYFCRNHAYFYRDYIFFTEIIHIFAEIKHIFAEIMHVLPIFIIFIKRLKIAETMTNTKSNCAFESFHIVTGLQNIDFDDFNDLK